MKSRITLFSLGGVILIVTLVFLFLPKNQTKGPVNALHLNDKDISLIIVDTFASREQGLSGRESLPENSGMLFVFDYSDTYGFWMKDMKFPIDIIWIDAEYKIVHIEENLSPSTYPKVFTPQEKSLYVLEVNAGFARTNNLKVGNVLNFVSK